MVPRDDVIAVAPQRRDEDLAQERNWREKTADIRGQIDQLEAAIRQERFDYTFEIFPQRIKDLWRKPASRQTPLEQAIYVFANRHVKYEQRQGAILSKMTQDARRQWDELQKRLSEFDSLKPDLPRPMAVSDIGPIAPVTRMEPGKTPLEPLFPVVLVQSQPDIHQARQSTGRL